jgi:RsiW-degrading membrane proteinase PrsW (M82 family)
VTGSTASLEDLLLLLLVSLAPALVYLTWVRGGEGSRAKGWGTLLWGFAYGAIFATVVAGILELVIVELGTSLSQRFPAPEFAFLNGNSTAGAFFLVLIVAPFIEEALKGSGVAALRGSIGRVADGPVVGASVGLGFGFFETFLYGLGAYLVGGLAAGIALILVRSVSSVVLHGSSTGMFGFGYARARYRVPGPGSGAYYLLAVLMHASFNVLASASVILALVGVTGVAASAGAVVALLAAIGFAFGAIEHVRTVTQSADYPALLRPPRTYAARPPSRGR